MKNYKLVEMIADKIYANKEYGIRYELEKYEDQIKLEYGPQMFRDLQLKVQENREDEVSEWLKTSGFIKSETVEFHEGFVRSQIRKILKETPNSFQGGKPFVRRSDQDYHDANNENESRDMPGFEGTMDQLDNLYNKPERSVTKRDWDRADDYQRVTWLLQVIDDSDDAERHAETEWEYLPDEARDFMKIEESAIDKSKKNYADWKKSVNENDYPTSAPRVYVLMLGNRSRGTMGPYRVYVDKATAEAEATKQEAEGKDTKAFVQDLAFIK